jgi:hypothetical protein
MESSQYCSKKEAHNPFLFFKIQILQNKGHGPGHGFDAVKVLLIRQWKESYLRKGIVDKTVERELPT